MLTGKTRREFLISTGAATALAFLPTKVARADSFRIRKDVTSLSAKSDLASLRKGVEEMKKLIETNPSDPRGWIMQAFIHGDCENGFTHCQHNNWYFAPWHRSYLYYFEKLIQHFSGNPDFALPYWNWSQTISVPSSFYGEGNPLADNISIKSNCSSAPPAGRGIPEGEEFTQDQLNEFVGPTVIEDMQDEEDNLSYLGDSGARGNLEYLPHNFVHNWVAGGYSENRKSSNMAQSYSPLDPIFWMHHCNVDRLYSDWLPGLAITLLGNLSGRTTPLTTSTILTETRWVKTSPVVRL